MEHWKPIEGFENLYEISNKGRVKSLGKGKSNRSQNKILKQRVGTHGYFRICLCKDSKTYTKTVHRLVAKAFLRQEKGKTIVNHLDENKLNNNVSNLEMTTSKGNINHGTSISRMTKTKSKPLVQENLDGSFVKKWVSANEVGRNGFDTSAVVRCCNNQRKTHKGFQWSWV